MDSQVVISTHPSFVERVARVRRSDWVWLTAILSIAAALRIVKLNAGLWFDEIVTLVEFVRLPTSEVVRTFSSLNNHILYTLEAKAAIAIFGESAWALRLPAMLFGVGCVAALWWFAREVVSPQEANMTALLLAVSYHHIWFSQNARGYTGLMFWSIVGTGLFLRGLTQSRWSLWVAYACVIAAAAYTHLSAGFFFIVHGLLYLVLSGKTLYQGGRPNLKPFVAFVLAGALIVLLHAPILSQILHAAQSVSATASSETTVAEWKNPLWTVLEVGRNLRGLGPLAAVGLPAVIGFMAIGAVSLWRRHSVFVAILITHIPLTLFLLLMLSFRIWPRYFFIDLAFIFLCVIRGVFVVSEYLAGSMELLRKHGETLGVAASGLAVCCSLFLLPPNYRYPKQDFLGALNFVKAAQTPEDTVASVGLASFAFSKYYAPGWKVVNSWNEIQSIRTPTTHVWLIYTSEAHMNENYPDVIKGVASDFELKARFPGTLGDGTVFVYRSVSNSAKATF